MAELNTENIDELKRSELEQEQSKIDRAPFKNFKIDKAEVLDTIEGREICRKCYKSRKFFCYTCCTPVIDEKYMPRVKLPIKIDIVKHAREIDGKSTAIHAAVLAPEDVRIFTYPDFPEIIDKEETILIFPSKSSVNVDELFFKTTKHGDETVTVRIKNAFPIKRAIFIDSTWHQTKSIYKDQRLRDLRCVILKSRMSQFWRHQKKSPRWYLATIEAIHEFLVELHTCAFGAIENYAQIECLETSIRENRCTDVVEKNVELSTDLYREYCGQYDNLLYFFKYMYDKIHTMYDHDKLWAYKRPLL